MKYYVASIHWTSETDSRIISNFIVNGHSAKDAITKVLLKHSFPTLNDRLEVYAVELSLAMRNSHVYAIGNTNLNG